MSFDPTIFLSALRSPAFFQGALETIRLTIVAMAFGLLGGLVLGVLRDHRWRGVRIAVWTYVWVFRAVPTLVQLLFVWNALPQLFPALKGSWFTPFLAASIALSMNEAAYAAEIVRGGLLSIDEGQRQAARALGLTPFRTFRRVILPQLMRVIIPPLSNDFITMLKITSLAYVLSLRELLTTTAAAVSTTFRFAEYYGAAAVYYLVIVSVFMLFQGWLERRFEWSSQRGGRTLLPFPTRVSMR
jgi:His/Glu/Gln/Arg/opine family amino acid ABC transporter permease subunit